MKQGLFSMSLQNILYFHHCGKFSVSTIYLLLLHDVIHRGHYPTGHDDPSTKMLCLVCHQVKERLLSN